MAWYNILFIATFALFFVKLCISLFAGDIDMDVDFDGDSDVDTSSAFSFKGLLHFCLGFSSYLAAKANFMATDMLVNENGNVIFGIWDYVIAVIFGIVMMLLLFYGYKLALKANATPTLPQDNIDGAAGTVYLNLGNGQYSIQAHTVSGTTNVVAFYPGNLDIGTPVWLHKRDGKIDCEPQNVAENDNEGTVVQYES